MDKARGCANGESEGVGAMSNFLFGMLVGAITMWVAFCIQSIRLSLQYRGPWPKPEVQRVKEFNEEFLGK